MTCRLTGLRRDCDDVANRRSAVATFRRAAGILTTAAVALAYLRVIDSGN